MTLGGEAFIFIVFWIIASVLWGIWLKGISVPLLGLFSAIVFRLMIILIRWIDAKI